MKMQLLSQLRAKVAAYSSARYAATLLCSSAIYLVCQLFVGLILLDFEDRYPEHYSTNNFAWYWGTLDTHLVVMYWAAVVLSCVAGVLIALCLVVLIRRIWRKC